MHTNYYQTNPAQVPTISYALTDPETTHTLYDGQWMMVVDDGVVMVVGGG